jgi:acetyl-CoA acetyltransferase
MMAAAGVQVSDINVAEVHDCFAVTELLMYEAIGLCGPGKGAEFFKVPYTYRCAC